MADPRHLLGQRGEAAAARWLAGKGWRILERRWRGAWGELDLVCRDPGGAVVAVEVKLRSTGRSGAPGESLDARRLGRLRRSLAEYAGALPATPSSLRVDLVTLTRQGSDWRLAHYRGVDAW